MQENDNRSGQKVGQIVGPVGMASGDKALDPLVDQRKKHQAEKGSQVGLPEAPGLGKAAQRPDSQQGEKGVFSQVGHFVKSHETKFGGFQVGYR